MLFSEPKIPQWTRRAATVRRRCCFSALQRAENSSMLTLEIQNVPTGTRFSALQRAENSSIQGVDPLDNAVVEFQCSSASRKFLNSVTSSQSVQSTEFQCSSASRKFLNASQQRAVCGQNTFQCSSASRKFLNERTEKDYAQSIIVSVLFSEPKIPQ